MKNLVLIFGLCLFFQSGYSQLTLEHTYNNKGYFVSYISPFGYPRYGTNLFYMVHLEIDGEKYVQIDKRNQLIYFYHLNHSLWKTIDYSNVQNISPDDIDNYLDNCSILYISQNLFDTDNDIEFLYCNSKNYSTYYNAITHVVNEDGTIIFSRNALPAVQPTYHNQYYPIYNTTQGTKMILSNVNGSAEVYSLAGTFSNLIGENSPIDNISMNLFPNPSNINQIVTIEYVLPKSVNSATLKVFNSIGEIIKEINITNQTNKVQFSNEGIDNGIYYYSIVSENGSVIISQKAIKI